MRSACLLGFALLLWGVMAHPARAVEPHRSFHRLVTGNGWAVASFDRRTAKVDTFLEHAYRFHAPRGDAPDLCFEADESRDLAYDAYFGVRSGGEGDWLAEAPIDRAGYVVGTNIIEVEQHVGPERALRVTTWIWMPTEVELPALVMVAQVENVSESSLPVSVYGLLNFRLGDAGGGREPSAEGEQVSWGTDRGVFYEYSDASAGTMAYVPLSEVAHRTVSTGDASAYVRLLAGLDLDDVDATSGPTTDVAPGLQGPEVTLAPGETTSFAMAAVWALDEDAGPDVDALRAWADGRSPMQLVQAERDAWEAWHTDPPEGLDAEQRDLWLQSNAILRMGQVREDHGGFGQILASLPPGLGNPDAQWNIAWVRDMAYATAALARAGHLQEAFDAIAFQLQAGPGRHTDEVGMPYRISVTRYFGNGEEESDCNADGPNIEFDGFGLFLWSAAEWVRAGGDVEELRPWYPRIRDEIADVLVSLITDQGVIAPDSSIWEVHWNGNQKRFTYTSLAAARGLCDAGMLAEQLGEGEDAARWREAGARVREAVTELHTDPRGAFAQSAEDLLAGHNYVDAATVEAINWGVVDPEGRAARATVTSLLDNLQVEAVEGLKRNDDGGWYDSQEWVFVDFRLLPALRAVGRGGEADRIQGWVEGQALENDLQFSELHEAGTGDYAGSIPMVGFGAGAYILALDAALAPPACGSFAAEPAEPLPDGGAGGDGGAGDAGGAADAGRICPDEDGSCGGNDCSCSAPGGARPDASWLAVLFAFVVPWLRRRRAGGGRGPGRRRRLGAWLAALGLLLAGCGDDGAIDPPSDGGSTDADEPPPGLCEVELTFAATDSTPTVHVAGEWNDFSETEDELVDDGTGTYRTTLQLRPGVHAYKLFVEGDGRDPWRLDPDNPYRAYVDGVENSGLRVPDCTRPALEVESTSDTRPAAGEGRIEATLRYRQRRAAALESVRGELRSSPGETRELRGEELSVDGSRVRVEVSGLSDGKHTVEVVATDADGTESESVLLPVWIEADPFSWSDALVYLAMTDRFRNGDPADDRASGEASPGADWEGGDLEGITQSIEEGYFEELGVNALWITPWYVNPDGAYSSADETHQVTGYHGYWPVEPLSVDPRFGGEEALHELVDTAHEHGIRVLMDLVVNHTHEDHPYVAEHPTWFNTGCVCGTDGCGWTERRLDCLFRPYMPDFNWQNREAAEAMLEDSLEWLELFDLDGFRVDAVKHVVDGAVINLRVRVRERFETAGTRYFMMGETAMGWDSSSGPDEGGNVDNYGTISRYIGEDALDGQFDFVLYYAAALQFLGDEPGRGMQHVDFWTRASMSHYPDGAVMTPYIGSHDTARFLSMAAHPSLANNKWADLPPQPDWDEPYDRMYVALAWLFSLPGAPLLYYGDEYGQPGGADPDNRRMMRFGDQLSAREQAQLERVRALGRTRADEPGLRSQQYRPLRVTEDLWAVARGEGDDLVIVIVNRGGTPIDATIPVPREVADEGRTFEDALGSAMEVSVERAAIEASVPARRALYLR